MKNIDKTLIQSKIEDIDSLVNALSQLWNTGDPCYSGKFSIEKLAKVLDLIQLKEFIGLTIELLEQRKAELMSLDDSMENDGDWFNHLRPFQKVLVNQHGFWEPSFFYGYGSDDAFGKDRIRNVALCIGISDFVFPKELIRPFYSYKDMYMAEDDEVFNELRKKYPNYE